MENTGYGWKVFPTLDFICKKRLNVSKNISKYLHKQIWTPQDRQDLLSSLADIFMETRDGQFGTLFRPLLLDVVMRGCVKIERQDPLVYSQHRAFCVALSTCLQWPDIQRFTRGYMKGKPSFIKSEEKIDGEPKRKKVKKSQFSEESLCRSAWLYTHHLGDDAISLIPLEDMLPYLSHDQDNVRWYACQTVMNLQQMMAASREIFLLKHFTHDKCRALKVRHSLKQEVDISHDAVCVSEKTNQQSHTNHMILETDLCDRVTCVGGVILSKTSTSGDDVICLDLIPVPSNETNLHNLALAVSSGSPVLLQGVVGSGKTTLVEHLARLTGRPGPPHLMKIQLGDQMDSKALLGTYRCTEVPGEFVWQPGVLTQAVTQGYWVLLEDLDYAPMEVISVLLPLLETRTLSVPGHGDSITAAPGFHLFATQRLVTGSSGWQRQQSSTSLLLAKLWTTVLVEPLSRTELTQVLCSKYPQLETVLDKLLDIYFLLSAGDHQGALDVTMDTTDTEGVGKFLSHDGRLISTRDLMTWCGRISRNFDVTSTATANLVFQEAVDGFVACLSKPDKRMPLAEAIGAKLNMTKTRVEYFCLKYKPDVVVSPTTFSVGRVTLPVKETSAAMLMSRKRSTFSYTRQSSVLLERVAVCVSNREPVLLVGETGTGKTSSVQYLAEQLGHKLHVINMNQQSDSADLLGGFKPVDLRHIVKPFFEDFELLFCKSFSRKQNIKFVGHLQECFGKRKWEVMFPLMEHTAKSALQKFDKDEKKSKKWKGICKRLTQLQIQVQQTQNALAFTFMEGSLVAALRAGDWVLLDEINLAAMETLECLSGLLESTTGSVLLMERGDIEPVVRHPQFRLFACMNPATDVGKKDLSPGIRNRFTELFVDELEDSHDLGILVSDYLQGLSLTAGQVAGIVQFYMIIRTEATKKLTDGTGHHPHYSLRTLCRALRFAARNTCGSVARSLYEGFCLSFLTQLDRTSHPVVEKLVCQHVIGKSNIRSILKQALPSPPGGKHVNFEGYWISIGDLEPVTPSDYILTPSVRANLKDLARVVSAGQHPVLIQGETSVGKTSLIRWLSQSSGNTCLRVNNHEHTDLQEYVGCYAADENGKLAFKEGVLVEAMKKGHWIILDELNLAPTDVLEALNRLLDDNRELYITETQETVKAHPRFMLFATQNPPGHYGGRKMLSRAFRNRFVELHFDEIPSIELETILHERCSIPLSYAKRLIAVMLELQTRRRGSGVFAGKMGFMTLRDLFRWAERYKCPEMDKKKFYDWDTHLAEQGYMLLAGRVRKSEEGDLIQEVIQKHFKCKVNPSNLYTLGDTTSLTTKRMLGNVLSQSAEGFQHIVWTSSMRRMAVLIGQAVEYKEPILLVGETGCGKTTMCQMYAAIYQTVLHSVNCHLHTESADFLGGLRPVRTHSQEDNKDKLFDWVDGPLVLAMKGGAMFLIDEISLADDSVLERLNSVLETERTILLAEKGGGDGGQNEVEQVVAKEGFHVFATMNPGGDFGKKELSPALRNRFTEIWCPPSNHRQDLIDIIEHNLHSGIHLCNQEDGTSGIGRAIMDFVEWFQNNDLGKRCTVSIRDILTWVQFINTCATTLDNDVTMETEDVSTYNKLEPAVAYIHGACLVFLDGLGAGGMDSMYWSRLPSLPRKIIWPVKVIDWNDEDTKVQVFCKSDNAFFKVSRDQLVSFPGRQMENINKKGIEILKTKKMLATITCLENDIQWALDEVSYADKNDEDSASNQKDVKSCENGGTPSMDTECSDTDCSDTECSKEVTPSMDTDCSDTKFSDTDTVTKNVKSCENGGTPSMDTECSDTDCSDTECSKEVTPSMDKECSDTDCSDTKCSDTDTVTKNVKSCENGGTPSMDTECSDTDCSDTECSKEVTPSMDKECSDTDCSDTKCSDTDTVTKNVKSCENGGTPSMDTECSDTDCSDTECSKEVTPSMDKECSDTDCSDTKCSDTDTVTKNVKSCENGGTPSMDTECSDTECSKEVTPSMDMEYSDTDCSDTECSKEVTPSMDTDCSDTDCSDTKCSDTDTVTKSPSLSRHHVVLEGAESDDDDDQYIINSDGADSDMSDIWPSLQASVSHTHQEESHEIKEKEIVCDKNNPKIFVCKVVFSDVFNNKKKKSDRVQNQRHACFFCGELKSHIQDHLLRTHNERPEVQSIVTCKNDKEKDKLKSLLRAKGDHKHNRKVVEEKAGELLLFRRPTEIFNHEEFGPCIECFEWMKTTSLPKHLKTCRGDTVGSVRNRGYCKTMSDIAKGKKFVHASDILIKEVFTIMKTDDVGLVAREDELICALGENWLKSCVDNKVKRAYWASQHMRLAAKLLIELRNIDDSENKESMWYYLRPLYFDNLVVASLNICLPDIDDVEELGSPSNAIKMKYDLVRMLQSKSSTSSQMFDKSGEEKWRKSRKESESVLTDISRLWKTKVTKLARKVLLEKKLVKKEKLPNPKDIEKLGNTLRKVLTEAELDADNLTWAEFRQLEEYSQARLLTYNKRRSGEIEGITIKNYRHKLLVADLDEGLIGDITPLERYLMESHDLIQTRGKKGGIVPVLIPKECQKVLDFLADPEVRRKMKVLPSNTYLFPKQKDRGPIRAYDSLKKVCNGIDLREPDSITSTTLRKYMATLAQVMNLMPNELQQMCRHLGHTAKVHLTHYRTMSPYIERVNMGKILLMQDMNIQSKFVGKKLEDVDFYDILKPTEDIREKSGNAEAEAEPVAEGGNQADQSGENMELSSEESEMEMSKPKKKRKNQRWTLQEEQEVKKYFDQNFKNKVTPKMEDVLKVKRRSLKAGGVLHKRHYHLIVKKVSAMIMKDKRNG